LKAAVGKSGNLVLKSEFHRMEGVILQSGGMQLWQSCIEFKISPEASAVLSATE